MDCKTIFSPFGEADFGSEDCPMCGKKVRNSTRKERKAREKWYKDALNNTKNLFKFNNVEEMNKWIDIYNGLIR